jgi:anaerobic ribonucleoside-triphosphate reductase activating protein
VILEVNRILAPVTVLGAGKRLGLWVQGCRLRCPGCASVDTWIPGRGRRLEVAELARTISAEAIARGLDGLTLTGGEPFDQAEALAALVERVRGGLTGWAGAGGFDVLAFTGYAAAAAPARAGALWKRLDAAVCGPYRPDQPSQSPLVASANQELLVLSDLGRSKYPLAPCAPRMQAFCDGEDLTMVGLPLPGDLDAIARRLAERGVALGRVSWRN